MEEQVGHHQEWGVLLTFSHIWDLGQWVHGYMGTWVAFFRTEKLQWWTSNSKNGNYLRGVRAFLLTANDEEMGTDACSFEVSSRHTLGGGSLGLAGSLSKS